MSSFKLGFWSGDPSPQSVCTSWSVLPALSQMILWLLQGSAGGKSDGSLLVKWRAVVWQGALKCPDPESITVICVTNTEEILLWFLPGRKSQSQQALTCLAAVMQSYYNSKLLRPSTLPRLLSLTAFSPTHLSSDVFAYFGFCLCELQENRASVISFLFHWSIPGSKNRHTVGAQ